jgi:hypothetical protein
VRDAFAGESWLTRVEHDPATGSLLIEYQPGHAMPDEIIERASRAAGLCVHPGEPRRPDRTHGERILRACNELNESAYRMMGFRVEPRTLLPIGVAAMSAVFFVLNRGQRMPRWDNLAYWSVSLFAMLHGREIGRTGEDLTGEKPAQAPDGAPREPR